MRRATADAGLLHQGFGPYDAADWVQMKLFDAIVKETSSADQLKAAHSEVHP